MKSQRASLIKNRDSKCVPFHQQFPNMEFEEIEKSLWHAFDTLDKSAQAQNTRSSKVHKSKLKVLTNNLGQILGISQAEAFWDKVVVEDSVDFHRYLDIINSNLLFEINKPTPDPLKRTQIDDLCWMLCERSYRQRISSFNEADDNIPESKEKKCEETSVYCNTEEQPIKELRFSKSDSYKLWKIFNFLCELGEDGKVLYPLRADIEEAKRIAAEICQSVGLPPPQANTNKNRSEESNTKTTSNLDDNSFLLDFAEFVNVIVEQISQSGEDVSVISQGITEVYSQIVADIVRKGYMVKFGNKVTAWKERWFVLTASALRYFASSEERDLKGTIILCSECYTQSFPDKPGSKQYRFKLHTPNKHYELSAPSLKAKNEWLQDLKQVILSIGLSKESLQKQALRLRKKGREERRRLTAEEELKRCTEREKLMERERQLEEERQQRKFALDQVEERERLLQEERQKRAEEEERRRQEINQLLEQKRDEIEAEKLRFLEIESRLQAEREALVSQGQEALEAEREKRAEAECRLKEEETQLEAERKRLKELEEERMRLQTMVDEERALKRDEEIVRNLQSKILDEEFAKREELERLQEEQGKKLLEEQMTRHELEEAHKAQQEALIKAQEELEALRIDRLEADQNIKEVAERLRVAEIERQKAQERMKLKEMTSSVKLMQPLSSPNPNPFVTHRGLGAFVEADFLNNGSKINEAGINDGENCSNEYDSGTEQTVFDFD